MVCDNYVAHAFKPDVCRECGIKKAMHTNLTASAPTSSTTPSTSKPLVTAKPAPASTPLTAAPVISKPVAASSIVSNGNGAIKPVATTSLSSSATLSKPATSSSSAATTSSSIRPTPSASSAAAVLTSTSTPSPVVQQAATSTSVKSSKACDAFTAHSFFPNKCRECSQPKADHAISAIAAPAASTTAASNSAASSAALKTTPVKFSSPFKAPTLSTSSAAVTSAAEPSATPPVTVASTASSSIKQRLASLGGGFNPLMMNQAPPPATAAASTPTVDVARQSSTGSESSVSSPVSAVRKPSISAPRRQPSASSLPQFTSTGQLIPTEPASETEVRSEEVKAEEQQQQQQASEEETVPHTSPALPAAASHAHATVPVVGIAAFSSELFSPTSSAAPAEPTVESKAGALIGSSKNADMWDEEESDALATQPTPASSISDSTTNTSSTSSLPSSVATTEPATTSATDPEATVTNVSSYLARQKAAIVPVVAFASSALFGDDWSDEDDDASAGKMTASKSAAVAPTATAAQGSEKRGLFDDDVEKDENDELFRPSPIVPATVAVQPPTAAAPPIAQPTAAMTATSAPVDAVLSSELASASSLTTEATAPSVSAADFYAKQVETAPTPATTAPAVPLNKPTVPPRVASSVFFKPGGGVTTASTASASSSASAASAASASLSSSRPSPSSTQKQGVFFKVNSLGFEQKVSDAVTVVPVTQGRTSEQPKPTAFSASESTIQPAEHAEDGKSRYMSTLVQPSIAPVPPTKSTVNLFEDDDVDDSELFKDGPHTLGVVSRVSSIVHEVKQQDDLFGDADADEDGVQQPVVQRQHSNVFENDGFAGF